MSLLLGLQVSITLQIPSRAGHLMVATVVASLGFGLVAIVKVSNQPFRVTLQVCGAKLAAAGCALVLAVWQALQQHEFFLVLKASRHAASRVFDKDPTWHSLPNQQLTACLLAMQNAQVHSSPALLVHIRHWQSQRTTHTSCVLQYNTTHLQD